MSAQQSSSYYIRPTHQQQGDLSQLCIFIVHIDMGQGWLDEYVVFVAMFT